MPQYEIPAPAMNHFRIYDANADGNIDPYEFMQIIQDLNVSLFETAGNEVNNFLSHCLCLVCTFTNTSYTVHVFVFHLSN